MTERERLLNALFGNPLREHMDVKFFVGGGVDISSEDLCREAANMLDQMDASTEADDTFSEAFEQHDVRLLVAVH